MFRHSLCALLGLCVAGVLGAESAFAQGFVLPAGASRSVNDQPAYVASSPRIAPAGAQSSVYASAMNRPMRCPQCAAAGCTCTPEECAAGLCPPGCACSSKCSCRGGQRGPCTCAACPPGCSCPKCGAASVSRRPAPVRPVSAGREIVQASAGPVVHSTLWRPAFPESATN